MNQYSGSSSLAPLHRPETAPHSTAGRAGGLLSAQHSIYRITIIQKCVPIERARVFIADRPDKSARRTRTLVVVDDHRRATRFVKVARCVDSSVIIAPHLSPLWKSPVNLELGLTTSSSKFGRTTLENLESRLRKVLIDS